MAGFFNLASAEPRDQAKTGRAIMQLMRSVGDASPGSEWLVFKADPKAWLWKAGYRYDGPGAGPNGEVPANIKLVPVFDSADTMHVRIPWKDTIDPPQQVKKTDDYGANVPNRLPVLLASYFVRQCR